MEKKNDKRARDLADAVRKGKEEGKSLTEIFAEYGEKNGLARGSVRNAYYELVKKSRSDAFAEKYLGGERLTAQEIRSFGAEEERTLVKTVLWASATGARRGASSLSFRAEIRSSRSGFRINTATYCAPSRSSSASW